MTEKELVADMMFEEWKNWVDELMDNTVVNADGSVMIDPILLDDYMRFKSRSYNQLPVHAQNKWLSTGDNVINTLIAETKN